MKFKNLSLLFVLIFAVSFAGFSQVDDEEAQMFGSKRSVAAFSQHDFGQITEDVVEHIFVIKNTSMAELVVSEFIIPDGVGIILIDKIINKKEEGKFIVTVNKNYIDEVGEFNKEIVVKTVQKKPMGVIETKETTYVVKGKF